MAELVAAVRRGDADEVRALLAAGADPETPDDGLPVLCRAVAAYDEPVIAALLQGGADPLRRLPDGSTPLLRAVDGGSHLLVLSSPPTACPCPPRCARRCRPAPGTGWRRAPRPGCGA